MINLVKIWKKWLSVAQIIGNFQAQVILSVFYLIILNPVGLFFRFFADPLNTRSNRRTNFSKWEHSKDSLEKARKQY